MQPSPPPCEVRKLVAQVFRQLGTSAQDLSGMTDTLLIDEGRCAARSYVAGDLLAMWLLDVGILQFYDAQGNMLRTVSLLDDSEPHRRAA